MAATRDDGWQAVVQRAGAQFFDAVQAAVAASPELEVADRLSVAAAEQTGSAGASLSALFTPQMSVPIGVSGDEAALAEKIQFSTGQGPCWEAFATRRPVLLGTIGGVDGADGGGERWPRYASAVQAATTYRAVLAVPVRLASELWVALCLYSRQPVPPGSDGEAGADVELLADGVRRVLDAVSPPADRGGAAWLDSSSSLRRAAVWMAELQLMEARPAMDHSAALAALRRSAEARGELVDDVAVAVVSGRLTAEQVLHHA